MAVEAVVVSKLQAADNDFDLIEPFSKCRAGSCNLLKQFWAPYNFKKYILDLCFLINLLVQLSK